MTQMSPTRRASNFGPSSKVSTRSYTRRVEGTYLSIPKVLSSCLSQAIKCEQRIQLMNNVPRHGTRDGIIVGGPS